MSLRAVFSCGGDEEKASHGKRYMMKKALLMPVVHIHDGGRVGYVWQTPSERLLVFVSREYPTEWDALQKPPKGYQLLDSAWRPITHNY